MTVETRYPVSTGIEPFYHYALSWPEAGTRTDTPDLMGAFTRLEEEVLMAQGYLETAAEDLALAEADMAAGFETLPSE